MRCRRRPPATGPIVRALRTPASGGQLRRVRARPAPVAAVSPAPDAPADGPTASRGQRARPRVPARSPTGGWSGAPVRGRSARTPRRPERPAIGGDRTGDVPVVPSPAAPPVGRDGSRSRPASAVRRAVGRRRAAQRPSRGPRPSGVPPRSAAGGRRGPRSTPTSSVSGSRRAQTETVDRRGIASAPRRSRHGARRRRSAPRTPRRDHRARSRGRWPRSTAQPPTPNGRRA